MANRLAIAGIALLVPAIVGAMFVVTDFLFGTAVAALSTTAITALFVYMWFIIPIKYRLNGE